MSQELSGLQNLLKTPTEDLQDWYKLVFKVPRMVSHSAEAHRPKLDPGTCGASWSKPLGKAYTAAAD